MTAQLRVDTTLPAGDPLATMEAALASPAQLMARLGEYLQASTQGRFDTQTGPDGAAWQALTPRYQRRKKYNPDRILTLRGYLRGRIHWQADGSNAVLVGSNLRYAAAHQFGAAIERAAYSIKTRLRTDSKGQLLRQKDHKNLAVFAKDRHQRARESWHEVAAHTIHIPARPFLGVSTVDEDRMHAITLDWLQGR
ncbi:phage virion morphogenesis protein [Comamonas aquatica]|uniref:phage virion morphogenesis protein n=1 Tax=Comamonas aquatica TaxID=225991 RepID=UPI00244A62BD|nr:phage virion morphogenesis protein [Comamonas aquatica]MDH0494255.1 phage virion morphogenesis protein [Comamonas aquatica]